MKNPFIKSTKGRRCCSQSQLMFKPFWKCAGLLGMRRCFRVLQKAQPGAYCDTISHFANPPNKPVIALTIDDGLARGGASTSMADDVFCLLQKYNAHATFFVCTDYVQDQEESIQALFEHGHELGNHMQADRLWYYSKLDPADFEHQLQGANRILDDLEERFGITSSTSSSVVDDGNPPENTKTRWFRAPQGIMNAGMRNVVAEDETIKHVLGDCYCDDWCFAQEIDPLFHDDENANVVDGGTISPKLQARKEAAMKQVAKLMLSQVQTGSVAILHMPEKGFRQGNLLALEFFLRGIQEKGWSCVNLSEIQQLCLESEEAI